MKRLTSTLPLALVASILSCPAGDEAMQARQILDTAAVKGGLVVHVGCGDGRLTATLRANDSFIVHGLDSNAKNVEEARRHIQSLDLYGKVAIEQFNGKQLPYADNLVNVVVTSDECRVTRDEITRVLAPNGVALVGGKKLVKQRPSDIDEWTHFLHDAGNNAVARDTRVAAPRSLQWSAPPLWLRSHETPSGIQAMVCGGGRLFYIFDEGLVGITGQRLPERWALLCRDAFNGKLLWRRPIEKWGWPEWATDKFTSDWTTITGGRTVVPDENQRRLVVDGDRLYATVNYRAPLSILDATTGKTLATIPETAPVRQIIAADGVAVVYSQDAKPETEPVKRKGKGKGKGKEGPPSALIAVEGATGKVLWRKQIPALHALSLAVDGGRVVYLRAKTLSAFDLKTGEERWQAEVAEANIQTLVAHDGVLALLGGKSLEAHDGATGKLLWSKEVHLAHGLGSEGLYVINGVVWPDMLSVDDEQNPGGKSPNVLAIGYDLRTGAEKKRLFVKNLRSPEHHHRCYRNKATERFIISSMEGLELLDVCGMQHSQNNFVRGACKLGVMPCNGMLYVPPDQCFCDPGAKLLGFTAIGPAATMQPVPDGQRLERGPAYGAQIQNPRSKIQDPEDWPTFRHDAARHGATPSSVATPLGESWRVKLGGGLTQPVAVGDRAYVVSRDTHTLHALELNSGKTVWTFVAGGRIDSPPTLVNGLALFGSADGYVYCLRASDGTLAWRFLAAPCERRIVVNDQLESVWPVHGSVLVNDGVAYLTAGRSTYLDSGIRVYALDPATGKLLRQTTLSGPFPDGKTMREVSFFISGANSDVLVSEGGYVYMRQKKLTPALQEQSVEELSTKGEKDVGLHVFSTAGLLDASWYNRTFWMYAKRWPGFQLANQASKSGQLLVVDDATTYSVSVFYRRNVHTTMFFPAKEGYLLFADKNTTEPQIVGDAGARKPVEWLPQSDYDRGRGRGVAKLDDPAFGLDKMIGYTRAEPPLWKLWLPVRIRAMVKAGDTIFAAGPPDALDEKDPYAAFEGRKGASLVAVSAKDGKKLAELPLNAPPVFDGMIAASGRLLVALEDGSLLCLKKED
ncbi:MAG: PQQ-binding-like beta-propeller repeat protein [Verrucomicrobia bacterium]|nr:PQQ-binding-like beta-propeller repeat protein [Verrucomicrobiota bacterium]